MKLSVELPDTVVRSIYKNASLNGLTVAQCIERIVNQSETIEKDLQDRDEIIKRLSKGTQNENCKQVY